MKLSVKEDPAATEVQVDILCPRIDGRVRRIMAAAEMEDRRIVAAADGFLRTVGPAEVLYAESVDGRAFLYTESAVLEAMVGLADLEKVLDGAEFVRASRTLLVNLMHVAGLRPYLNARLELMMDNGERLIASRQFAKAIKKHIGL